MFRGWPLPIACVLVACSSDAALAPSTSPSVVADGSEDGGAPEEPSEPDAGAPSAPGCPGTRPGSETKVSAAGVEEASGVVTSAINEGVYWVHNDSGDDARAFAIGAGGELRVTLAFDTAKPRDVEDVAIEDVSPGKSFLYFGDIGDNDAVRPDVTIHRVEEPTLAGASGKLQVTSEKMTVTYENGPHNAETLLFDPIAKELLIATKVGGAPSEIHRIGAFVAGKTVTTEKIAEVDVDLATGGDISRDGKLIAIRNYTKQAFLWTRASGESIATALARPPCKIAVSSSGQHEAFAFLRDASGYVTIPEGPSPQLAVTLFQ